MNGQQQEKLINIILIIIGILFFLIAIRSAFITPFPNMDKVCASEYGENWFYNENMFGNTCEDVDYITLEVINRTELDLTDKEIIAKYCTISGFWEITKWRTSCNEN